MYSNNYLYLKNSKQMRKKSLYVVVVISGILFFIGYYVNSGLNSSEIKDLSRTAKSSALGLGCILNTNIVEKEHIFQFTRKSSGISVMNTAMLSNYSLEDYLPEIGDQGDVSSCVGWATAYYGLTLVKRIEHGKDYPAFSPLSVFNRFCYLKKLDPCRGGSYIDGCLSLLVTKGCPFVKDYDKPNCAVDPNNKKYSDCLFSFERLQQNNADQLKLSILNNAPVIIGLEVFAGGLGNNLNSKFLDSNGVAKMELFRTSRYPVGGHALCIVGFDDNIGGGAFKIANSWGSKWGKKGFFWLRYQDLDMVRCAFSMFSSEFTAKDNVNSLYKTEGISLMNETGKNVYVAVGFSAKNGIQTKGWYRVEAGLTRTISVAKRTSNEVYFIVMDENGTIFESNKQNKKLPLKSISFDLNASEATNSGVVMRNFQLWNPANKKQMQSLKISGESFTISE